MLMSNTARQESGHRRPHTAPMASPFLEFDLTAEINQLHRETTWRTGRNAKTLMKYDDFRVVLTALQANMRIPEHKTEGRISVHMLSGHVRLNASGHHVRFAPRQSRRTRSGKRA